MRIKAAVDDVLDTLRKNAKTREAGGGDAGFVLG